MLPLTLTGQDKRKDRTANIYLMNYDEIECPFTCIQSHLVHYITIDLAILIPRDVTKLISII